MMQMAKLLFDQMCALFLADVAGFANPLTPGMVYIGADFAPRPDLELGDIDIVAAGMELYYEPGDDTTITHLFSKDDPYAWKMMMQSTPYGWFADSNGAVLPLTIYGRAFVSNLANDLYGVEKFDPPLEFTRALQGEDFTFTIFTISPAVLVS